MSDNFQVTTMGKRIFQHYQNYPEIWGPAAFQAWEQKSRRLFEGLIQH